MDSAFLNEMSSFTLVVYPIIKLDTNHLFIDMGT
jgi:hypothetical protein